MDIRTGARGGSLSTTNGVAEKAVPLMVVTLISPVVAPGGTLVVMLNPLPVKGALTLLNETLDAPDKFCPKIVTPVPVWPV